MAQTQASISPSWATLAENESAEARFDDAVVEAVNDILSALGQSVKQAIYGHLGSAYGISADEIPVKIDAFAKAIEEIFGSAGKFIEVKIIERLHSRYVDFRYIPESGELDFVGYMAHLRDCLEIKV